MKCKLVLFAFIAALTAAAHAESWNTPIQCLVTTKVGESAPKTGVFTGITEANQDIQLQSLINAQDGFIKEVFEYKINVRLIAANIYTVRFFEKNSSTGLSATVIVPKNQIYQGEWVLTKEHKVTNGIGFASPRFSIKLQCALQGQ